jgi:hypothetical protein
MMMIMISFQSWPKKQMIEWHPSHTNGLPRVLYMYLSLLHINHQQRRFEGGKSFFTHHKGSSFQSPQKKTLVKEETLTGSFFVVGGQLEKKKLIAWMRGGIVDKTEQTTIHKIASLKSL